MSLRQYNLIVNTINRKPSSIKNEDVKCFYLFKRYLNRGCLVYMFSLRFSGSKFLIKLRRQFRVCKFFCTQISCGVCSLFILCLKQLLFRKCVNYVLGCSLIKTCSLTGC